MQLLLRPTRVDEVGGHPIEELRMRGLLGHIAEVIGRRNDPSAEVVHPHAIDEHAGGQRIGATSNRHSELTAAATIEEGLAIRAGKDFEELPRRHGARLIAVTTEVYRGVLRALAIGNDHRRTWAARVGQLELIDGVKAEILGRDITVAEAGRGLPRLAEAAGRDEHGHERDGGNLLVIGQGPRPSGQLGQRLVIALAGTAGATAQADMGDDAGVVLLEHGLVGQGDVIEGLRLEISQGLYDQGVHRILLVRKGGGESFGGTGGELGVGQPTQASQRASDWRVGGDVDGTVDLAHGLELVLLLDIEGLLRTLASHLEQGAAGELLMYNPQLGRNVTVVATGIRFH